MSKMSEQTTPYIESFTSGKKWSNEIHSTATKELYFRHLKNFCDAVGMNPDQLIEYKVDGLRNILTAKEWQAEDLVNRYLYEGNLTPAGQVSALTAIKSFYKANWRELNSNVGSKVEAPEAKARTPTLSDLVQLENSMASLRDKALLWFLESTAVRALKSLEEPTGNGLLLSEFSADSRIWRVSRSII